MSTAPSPDPLAHHDLGGEGPPLVLVHATGFHGGVWAPLASGLGGFHGVALDLPGHGRSPAPATPDGLGWDRAAEAVLATVGALDLDRPYGVGHSMGGAVLLLAEARRPGTFRALHIYEPVVFPPDLGLGADDNPLEAGARRRRATFASRAEALANYAAKPPLDVLHPVALRAYVDGGFDDLPDGSVTLRCRPEVEAGTYRMGMVHDAWDRLPEVACPVVVARGGIGPFAASSLAEGVAGRLPSGRLEAFEQLGHLGPLQDPAALAASVAAAFAPPSP